MNEKIARELQKKQDLAYFKNLIFQVKRSLRIYTDLSVCLFVEDLLEELDK